MRKQPLAEDRGTSIGLNSVAIIAMQLTIKASSLAGLALITRTLTVTQFGEYSLILALGDLFRSIVGGGIDQTLIRRLASQRAEDGSLLVTAVILKLGLAVLAALAAAMVATILGYGSIVAAGLIVLGVDFFFSGTGNSIIAHHNASHEARRLLPAQAFSAVAYVIAGVVGFVAHAGVLYFVGAIAFTSAVFALSVRERLVRAYLAETTSSALSRARSLFVEALPLTALGIVALAYLRLDTLVVRSLSGPAQVGYYASAYRLSEAAYVVAFAVATSALPVFTAICASGDDPLPTYRAVLKRLMPILVPIVGAYLLFADDIVRWLYGARYGVSAPALQLMSLLIVLVGFNFVCTNLLIAAGKRRALLAIAPLILAANLTTTIPLVIWFGFYGAAAASVMTEAANMAAQLIAIRWLIGRSYALRSTWPALIALVPVALAAWLPHAPMPLIPRVLLIVATVIYLIVTRQLPAAWLRLRWRMTDIS